VLDVRLFQKLRRWWKPQRLPDHPLSEPERIAEVMHSDHFWSEAQKIGGPGGRGVITSSATSSPRSSQATAASGSRR
jgi:hypothetical protein